MTSDFPTNEEIAEVSNLICGDSAFQNATEPLISFAMTTIADQLPKLSALEGLSDPNGIDDWLSTDFTSVLSQLTLLDTGLDDFLAHTNRVSGVTFNGDFLTQRADFNALLSVSTALEQVETNIGEGLTDTLSEFFGSLTDSPAQLNIFTIPLVNLDLKIQELPPFNGTPHPTPTETLQNISDFINYMSGLVATENNNYDNAIRKLRCWGLSSSLKSPNALWRDFVVDTVATPELAVLIP